MATNRKSFVLRMQQENFDKIKVIADENKRSIARQIEFLLEQFIKSYESQNGKIAVSSDKSKSNVIQSNSNGNNLFVTGGNNYMAI